jgi:hypothetical protein
MIHIDDRSLASAAPDNHRSGYSDRCESSLPQIQRPQIEEHVCLPLRIPVTRPTR